MYSINSILMREDMMVKKNVIDVEICVSQTKKIIDDEYEKQEEGMGLAKFLASLFAFAYSIAMLVMGSLHFEECSLQPMVPVYLFVAGLNIQLGFVAYFSARWKNFKETWRIVVPFVIFFIVWFIAGSVWVFSNVDDWHYPYRCNVDLFNFARGSLVFFWGTALTSVIIGLCRKYVFP